LANAGILPFSVSVRCRPGGAHDDGEPSLEEGEQQPRVDTNEQVREHLVDDRRNIYAEAQSEGDPARGEAPSAVTIRLGLGLGLRLGLGLPPRCRHACFVEERVELGGGALRALDRRIEEDGVEGPWS
jgi:hypothetical protein